MKVIAKIKSRKYVCEVTHGEIEKFTENFFNKITPLEVGDNFDLGAGYDHLREIRSAMEQTKKFIKANKTIIEAITNGLLITNDGGS